MAESKFVYNARFVGRKLVDGPLNDFRLSEVVAVFQNVEPGVKKEIGQSDEVRCNVEFSDRNLLITFIKKDEGFESDTESAKSVETPDSGITMRQIRLLFQEVRKKLSRIMCLDSANQEVKIHTAQIAVEGQTVKLVITTSHLSLLPLLPLPPQQLNYASTSLIILILIVSVMFLFATQTRSIKTV